MKERIKELLLSVDKESRLLGLSYLGENKRDSNKVYCLVSKKNNYYWNMYTFGCSPRGIPTVSNLRLTNILGESGIIDSESNKQLLDIYINYCYEG